MRNFDLVIEDKLCLDDFIYDLPLELVAQEPLASRDLAKLLVRDFNGSIVDSSISDLADHIPVGSTLIVNNSKVIPSRLLGTLSTGAKAEIMLLEQVESDKNIWKAIGKPTKRLNVGCRVDFGLDLSATVITEPLRSLGSSPFEISFNLGKDDFNSWITKNGYIPLPPYIVRKSPDRADISKDRDSYQTVYAEHKGSVAAPTAGLHFTENVLERLKRRDVRIASVTLHVGAGTFLPVKDREIDKHIMHDERYLVPRSTLMEIESAKKERRKIIAVGTTTLRSLESLYLRAEKERIDPFDLSDSLLRTDLFIRPKFRGDKYRAHNIDALMTNFHQPGSTLFMLISALIGVDEARRFYQHAVERRYRFFSYGDSSLLWV